jgi:outer membrane lipoprotein carrier protein
MHLLRLQVLYYCKFALNVISAMAMLLVLPQANASGLDDLKAFYANTKSVSANFVQVVTDKQGRKVQSVEGNMQLKRPNMFRWNYSQPYEQQMMSDGKKVWLYDVELAQVTVSDISKALGASPAALLAGDQNLDKKFTLTNINRQDDVAWISALPTVQDSGFEKILLGFSDGKISKMELLDSFGQFTKISFSNVVQNPSIADKEFKFNLPKGVDVVGE